MGVNLHEKLSGLRSKNMTSVHQDVLEGFKTLLNAPKLVEWRLRVAIILRMRTENPFDSQR